MEFVATVRRALDAQPQDGMTAEGMAYDLLSILRQNGSIRVPRGSPFHEAVRRLNRKRPAFLVFLGRGGSGTYVITPEFRSHFEQLFTSLLPQPAPITNQAITPPPPFLGSVPAAPPIDSTGPQPSGATPHPQMPAEAHPGAPHALPVARPREPATPITPSQILAAANLPVARTR